MSAKKRKTKSEKPKENTLSRREREIMDIVFSGSPITARTISEQMDDPPTYSTVRTLLAVLVRKGHLTHQKEGSAFLYSPTQKRSAVAASALHRLVETFFEGSVEQAVSGLLNLKDSQLTEEEAQRISDMIEQAKKGEGQS